MDIEVERLFLFRHGDYNLDEKTGKQTLAAGYKKEARKTIEALKKKIDPNRSMGFGSAREERHLVSIRYVASQLGQVIHNPEILCDWLASAHSDIAAREIINSFKEKPRAQYIICASQGAVGKIGLPYALFNHLGINVSEIMNAQYSTQYWYGIDINLRTGKFESLP